jgi:hypothetical protein
VDEVNAKLEEADAKLKTCLGENWTRRRFSADEQTTYSYEAGQDDPVVALRTAYVKTAPHWWLLFNVDRPKTYSDETPAKSGAPAETPVTPSESAN